MTHQITNYIKSTLFREQLSAHKLLLVTMARETSWQTQGNSLNASEQTRKGSCQATVQKGTVTMPMFLRFVTFHCARHSNWSGNVDPDKAQRSDDTKNREKTSKRVVLAPRLLLAWLEDSEVTVQADERPARCARKRTTNVNIPNSAIPQRQIPMRLTRRLMRTHRRHQNIRGCAIP